MIKKLFWLLAGWRVFGPIVAPRFRPPQEHPWRIEGHTVFVGDQEFLVRRFGEEGAPDVVLIHGLGGSSLSEWYKLGPVLADRFRLTVVDHRSHGLSPKVVERFEIEDLADDLAGVMDRLGLASADVVGYSMGGVIAQALAHRHRGRVRRLALVATFANHPPAFLWMRKFSVVLIRAFERLTGFGTAEVRAGYLIATGAVEHRHARWAWEETHRRDTEAGAMASAALFRFDSRPWVGSLDAPSLVVIPTEDQLVPPSWQYALAAALPDATVVEVDGGRHEVPWTHPDQVAKALISFFEQPD